MKSGLNAAQTTNPMGTRVLSLFVAITLLTGCAATSSEMLDVGSATPRPKEATWKIDNAEASCIASIAGGAVVGGILGAKNKNAAGGVAAGIVAGGAVCAIILTLDKEDKKRLKEAQLSAATSNETESISYKGSDGALREIVVKPMDLTPSESDGATTESDEASDQAAAGKRVCRRLQSSIKIEGKGETEGLDQVVCRSSEGDWEPV